MNRNVITKTRMLSAAVLLAIGWALPANAENPIPTALDTAEGKDFLGLWRVKLDVMGNEIELFLNIVDMEGKMGATLDSEEQAEPLALAEIKKAETEGLELSGELKFGPSFSLSIIINLVRDGENLGGTIKDVGGLFAADLVGTPMKEEELDGVQGRRPDATEARMTVGDKRIRIAFAELAMNTSDWDLFQKVQPGEVFKFTLSRSTKLLTDLDLVFGDKVVKAHNITETYPGAYSMWLKRVDDGWTLVFNNKPDIWGTRHNPDDDAVEVPLTVSEIEGEPQEKFLMLLEDTGEDSGTLKVRWGNQEWAADFKTEVPEAAATPSA